MRNWPGRRIGVATLGAALSLALAGCGDTSGGAPVAEWRGDGGGITVVWRADGGLLVEGVPYSLEGPTCIEDQTKYSGLAEWLPLREGFGVIVSGEGETLVRAAGGSDAPWNSIELQPCARPESDNPSWVTLHLAVGEAPIESLSGVTDRQPPG